MRGGESKETIKQRLIDVAQSVFAKFGFDRTTMEIIAKEAKKGKSTLYYYFKSKEEIFAAVIEREGNMIQRELMKIIGQNKDSRTLLREYVIRRYSLIGELVNYYNVFRDDYLSNLELIEKYRRKHDEFELLAIKQILIKGIMNEELTISPENVDDVALAIAVALKGLEIPLFLDGSMPEFDQKIDMLLDVLFCGIGQSLCGKS